MKFDLKAYSVLVTGAAGVLGSALSKVLLESGARVIAFDLEDRNACFEGFLKKYSVCEFISGSLKDDSSLTLVFDRLKDSKREKVCVFHMAAMSDANQCEKFPQAAFEVNVEATARLLDHCRRQNVRRVTFPSTAYVYGTSYLEPAKEDFGFNPESVYAQTKIMSEELMKNLAHMPTSSVDIVRISNIYGPQSKDNTIVGTIVQQIQTAGAVSLRNLKPVRDFIYIDDVIEAFIRLLIAKDEPGCRIMNLSTNTGTSVGRLAEIFCEMYDLPTSVIKCTEPNNLDSYLVLDNDKLAQRTGWKPGVSVHQGVSKIAAQWQGTSYV